MTSSIKYLYLICITNSGLKDYRLNRIWDSERRNGVSELIVVFCLFQYVLSFCIPIHPNISLAFLAIGGVSLGISSNHRLGNYKGTLVYLLASYLLLISISILLSVDRIQTILLNLSFIPAILVFFLTVEVFSLPFAYLIFIALSITSLLISIICIKSAIVAGSTDPLSWLQDVANINFLVPNDLVFLSIIAPVSIVLFTKSPRSAIGFIALLSVFSSLAALTLYQSRTGVASALVGISVACLLLKQKKAVKTIAIIIAFVFAVDMFNDFKLSYKIQNLLDSRFFIWLIGWNMFCDAPWFGHGPRTFAGLYYRYRDNLDLPLSVLVDDRWMPWAHNFFLETLIEQGTLGFIILLMIIVTTIVGLRNIIKICSNDFYFIAVGVLSTITTIAIAGLFDLSFIRIWFITLFVIALAFVQGLYNCTNIESSISFSKLKIAFLFNKRYFEFHNIAKAIILFFVIWSTIQQFVRTNTLYRSRVSVDTVGVYQKRFKYFDKLFQPFEIVGFQTDEKKNLSVVADQLNIAQYILAPAIIIPTERQLESLSDLLIIQYSAGDTENQKTNSSPNFLMKSVCVKGMEDPFQMRFLRPSSHDFVITVLNGTEIRPFYCETLSNIIFHDMDNGILLTSGH